jgi:drug/metabolite transporter (DMT)-like permease
MNFSPQLDTGTAIFMSLLAASMWGSWFISLKYLGDYPIDGFYVTLFTTSLLLVWSVAIIVDGEALFENLGAVWAVDSSRIWLTLVCGVLYVIGMRLSLFVMGRIGLSLTQPIQQSINILAGTAVAAFVGGVPEDLSLAKLALACTLLVGAVLVTMLAGNLRAKAQQAPNFKSTLIFTPHDLWKALGLLVFSSAFIPAYTFAISYGLKSVTQPNGLAVLPFMAVLVSGAFTGSLLTSGLALTRTKQWRRVFQAPFRIHKFGIISGFFHYGGNIIHTYSTAFLSSAVSWPLSITAGLWTTLWGFVYGEFKDSPRSVYIALFAGIALYLLGAFTIVY